MGIQTIGIREAKAHLSRYIKMLRQGNEIILTDHGRPVGKLIPIPPAELSLEARLRQLTDKGLLADEGPPCQGDRPAPVPIPIPIPEGLAHALLQQDRGA